MKMTREQYLEMYKIVGCAMEVYNALGRGLAEQIYQCALESELVEQCVSFQREKLLPTYYKGKPLSAFYKVDFYCYDGIMVELKSVSALNEEHRAQLFNYMRLTKIQRGLLINFGTKSLIAERYWYDTDEDDIKMLKKSNLNLYVEKT